MGEITSFSVFWDNGVTTHYDNRDSTDVVTDSGRIEYEYAYAPDLLPPPEPSHDGMWRYSALLPFHPQHLYPMPIGGTPLIASAPLRQLTGLPALWIKDETRSPTGSNKDRATALALEDALQKGQHILTCASTGNVAASLAVGAAAVGCQAFIFVPASVSHAKLQLMLLAGATVFTVEEGYEAAMQLSRLAARTFGWYDRNTGYNPCTLEAKKTVALEIWEQLQRQLPDVILCPVGDGVTLSALAKGFRELIKCGVTTKLPRLIGVQAEGCAPLKKAWEAEMLVDTTQFFTIADGIAVSAPTNAAMALRDVRESQGSFIAVSDQAIVEAMHILASRGGLLAEPAGAVSFAGLNVALKTGLIQHNQTIVCLLTGTGLKNMQDLNAANMAAVHHIHADINDVLKALDAKQA